MRRLAARIAHEADRAGHSSTISSTCRGSKAANSTASTVALRHLVTGAVDRVDRVVADVAAATSAIVGELPTTTCCVDASQVERALVNLIENAVKYSDPGKPVDW